MIVITLKGEPHGQGRPRSRIATNRTGHQFVAVYKDANSRAYERALAMQAKITMGSRPPLEGPLAATVMAVMGVPSSWSRKSRDKALAGVLLPTGRPDCDNVFKSLDALHGIVFQNDAQIVEASITKRYGEEPMLRVEVRPLEIPLMAAPAMDMAEN